VNGNVTKESAKNFIPKKLFGMKRKSVKQKLASKPKLKLGDYSGKRKRK
jgi:hypothetical protein|tara:strand:- start:28927 stop:29073 length:147 start_codon:yes stop_codon:yes gene_type:complete